MLKTSWVLWRIADTIVLEGNLGAIVFWSGKDVNSTSRPSFAVCWFRTKQFGRGYIVIVSCDSNGRGSLSESKGDRRMATRKVRRCTELKCLKQWIHDIRLSVALTIHSLRQFSSFKPCTFISFVLAVSHLLSTIRFGCLPHINTKKLEIRDGSRAGLQLQYKNTSSSQTRGTAKVRSFLNKGSPQISSV
jgi:hypothetical protein